MTALYWLGALALVSVLALIAARLWVAIMDLVIARAQRRRD